MVTLEQTQEAMLELIQPGTPCGKLAFWNGALSKRNRLENNCRQALLMRKYLDNPLPADKEELHKELGACLDSTLDTLYAIEKLWNEGKLNFNSGFTFASQAAWRERMVEIIPGMGYKTVSFALHIFSPFICQLLTIDCWHVKRMGTMFGDINARNYALYEAQLREDIAQLASLEPGYTLIVYAAYFWENMRKDNTVTPKKGKKGKKHAEYSSHAGLSCYV